MSDGGPAEAVLRYGPTAIRATASRSASVPWLVEFLAPALTLLSGGAEAVRQIAFESAPERHAALKAARATADWAAVDAIGFDGRFSRCDVRNGEDGTRWAYEPAADVFYGLHADGVRISVVAPREESYERIAWMRVVREFATSIALREGWLPLHAAAFAVRGGVVLVCGARRSGKTSVLLGALTGGAELVSNDRVFVDHEAAPRARSMPTIVALRSGTLHLFPEIGARFAAARFDRGRTIAECAAGIRRPAPTRGPDMEQPGISLAQLAELAGARVGAGGPVRAIVFPRVDEQARGLGIASMPAREAACALQAAVFRSSSRVRESDLFRIGQPRFELPLAAELAGCHRLAGAVPAYRWTLGAGAFERNVIDAFA